MPTERSARAQRLLEELTQFIDDCEEANALLDFAETTREPITWNKAAGESLRDALREAKRREEGGR